MIEKRQWVFTVTADANENGVMCIVGSCPELGSWNPHRIIPLEKVPNGLDESCAIPWNTDSEEADQTSGGSEVLWSISLQLPLEEVQYRYCIAVSARDESLSEPVFAIKSWETHFCPRTIPANVEQNHAGETISKFGVSLGQRKVEAGWLVYDSAVQLKLGISKNHADPIVFWRKRYKDRKVRVKVTPLELNTDGGLLEDTTTDHGDSRSALATAAWPLVEVAVLKENSCAFSRQDQFGLLFNAEDFTTFQCRLINPNSIAYLFDFYLDASPGEIPRLIGCSHLLPSNLIDNFGVATIPITSSQHSPIGQLTVHYMVVKPMPLGASDMSASFARYWKESWTGLEVGHRGAGNSYHSEPKSCATIRENTIASFKYAAEMGADMVETDVQLSKDLVPVIYHDFHACIALKRKKDQEAPDLLEIPIKDLTLAQLQALKVYHRKEKGLSKFRDEGFEDHQPFPTLEQSLKTVPDSCGFNVEIKWTMQLACGTYELLHPFELNRFLDLILKVVLEHGGRRKIVFSSFHPDICSMLRLKQNRYPVLFLTQGVSEIWPAYDDYRCQDIRQAVLYASSADILGINLHTEELLRDPTQMDLALKYNLIVFCWGEHNNDRSTIAYLKSLGMHGIIYDKIDVYNNKEEKKSIFLCEERNGLGNHSSLRKDKPTSDESSPVSKSLESSAPGPSSENSDSDSAAVVRET